MSSFTNLVFPRRFGVSQFLKILALSLVTLLILIYGFKHELHSSPKKTVLQRQSQMLARVINKVETSAKSGKIKTITKFHHRSDINPTRKTSTQRTLHKKKKSSFYTEFKPPPNIFNRTDVGEMGVPVKMPDVIPTNIQKFFDEGWKKNEFNQYLSDLISFRRKLPDYRTDWCKQAEKGYSKKLPTTSIIIIFHNEAWSTLLRSVHSVIDRSPEHLIEEIILVDDFSSMNHLKKPLDDYFEKFSKVQILRGQKREGLIRARLKGAAAAKGEVLTFLDSHIECTTGWLEPLLDRIAKSPTNVAVPIIDCIKDDTFEYRAHTHFKNLLVGGFDWNLNFRWHKIPDADTKRKKDLSEPTRSPTMAGGLYSIDKKYFEKLGTYDPGFDIWGAENLEISFKIWMCGGTLEIIPCSHVGHIFRKESPYSWPGGFRVIARNSHRLAKVWMDEYAEFYHIRKGPLTVDFGDVSQRQKLRKSLGCKSFKWYLKNVYPDLKIPSDGIAYGAIRNLGFGNESCLDAPDYKEAPMRMHRCSGAGGNQYFEYDEGFIHRDNFYLHYQKSKNFSFTFKEKKHSQNMSKWNYDNETLQIYLKGSGSKCLAINQYKKLLLEDCSTTAQGQQWDFERLNLEKLKAIS